MVHRRIGGRSGRRGLVAILLLLIPAAVHAADTATIEFEPDRVVKGNRFDVQIRTSIPWGEEVLIDRPELEGPMVWWAYPYARPWTAVAEDGSSVRMIEVLAALRLDAPGFHTIGPFRITAGDRSVLTAPKEIIGLEPDEADLPYPVFTGWRSVPGTVWQGEAVPVVLEARNLASLALAESVTLDSAPRGLLEDAPGFGGIVTRPHGNDILYDVPMSSWIWTQQEAGISEFPSVRVSVGGLSRYTPSFQLDVRPLPEEALESGAVGYFRLITEMDEGPYYSGDIISVRIRVEGEGNINVLNPPIPELDGASLVGQGSSSSYLPGPRGYEGWREERYDFQIERTGSLNLRVPGWYWFEPDGEGRLRRESPWTGTLESFDSPGDPEDTEQAAFLGADMFRYGPARFHWRNPYWFLLALPGAILLIVLFLMRHPGSRAAAAMMVFPLLMSASGTDADLSVQAAAGAFLAAEGDWEAAALQYGKILDAVGESPGLLHDMALVEMERGHADTAVALLRRALRLRPGTSALMNDLVLVEDRLGLDDQIRVPLRWPPAVFFTVFLAGVNFFFLALVLLMFRKEARDVIILVSAIILLTAGTFSVVYADRLWESPVAVVVEDSRPLRKIPGPLAMDWIQLPAGSAVSIVAEEGSDVLVRTGYGLEGWLPSSSLIPVTEAVDGF